MHPDIFTWTEVRHWTSVWGALAKAAAPRVSVTVADKEDGSKATTKLLA
jgi:hypothetical protein